MKTIYKYPFEVNNKVSFSIPSGYKILSIQMQGDTPCLWVMVEATNITEVLELEIYGTGVNMPPVEYGKERVHISTFQDIGYVFHVFQVKNGEPCGN